MEFDAGECLHTFEGHSNSVKSVSFSPDGTKVVSGSGRCEAMGCDEDRAYRHLSYILLLCLVWRFLQMVCVKNARGELRGSHPIIHITTYAFSWLKDAKNMLRAFAIRQFQGDPLPFVRRMFPGLYDGEVIFS